MSWLELSIETKAEAVDWVCSLLSANGYDGEVRVGAGGAGWPHRVAFYLPRADRRAAARLAEALDGVTRTGMAGALRVEPVAGKPRAPPEAARPLGRRFVLLGPLAPAPPAGDRLPIRLGAGLAFGSGLHPTTLATLRLVERHARAGQRALDLGSGSGILSIALARLGARVLALDNDPVAVEATRAAVRINGVGDAVEVRHGSLGRGAGLGHWLRWAELAVPRRSTRRGPST
ncbi:MAG TPA: 50S ribosomal protein L11 methyltransferase [Chloroflexota bacterium]|nr:50S ribosomal protein L11 methyltransferase [Chloroflexota bacterium]